jgi:hypothetical protein
MLGIDILKRMGGGGTVSDNVELLDDSVSGTLSAQWTISSNGFTYKRTGGSQILSHSWINPQSGMDLYEVHVAASETLNSGTVDTWLPLTSDYMYALGSVYAEKVSLLTVQIRRASDAVVVDTATISLWVAGAGLPEP